MRKQCNDDIYYVKYWAVVTTGVTAVTLSNTYEGGHKNNSNLNVARELEVVPSYDRPDERETFC